MIRVGKAVKRDCCSTTSATVSKYFKKSKTKIELEENLTCTVTNREINETSKKGIRIGDDISVSKYFKKSRTKIELEENLTCPVTNRELNETSKKGIRIGDDFFLGKNAIQTAKSLLGQVLCRREDDSDVILKGRIVETEAYLGKLDEASHSFDNKMTPRNEPMYMKPGTCYVYFTYGMYHCFNLSADETGAAILIRSVEPLEGSDAMKRNRLTKSGLKKPLKFKDIANGPGKLCIAMNIDKNSINKKDICTSNVIWLEKGDNIDEDKIVTSKRIGIKSAGEWNDKPLRYYIFNSEFVSVRDKKAELTATKRDK